MFEVQGLGLSGRYEVIINESFVGLYRFRKRYIGV